MALATTESTLESELKPQLTKRLKALGRRQDEVVRLCAEVRAGGEQALRRSAEKGIERAFQAVMDAEATVRALKAMAKLDDETRSLVDLADALLSTALRGLMDEAARFDCLDVSDDS